MGARPEMTAPAWSSEMAPSPARRARERRELFAILSLIALGAVLIALYQQKFESGLLGRERVKLLVAVKPIEHGKVITEDMLITREVPLAYAEERAVKAVDRAKIIGLRAGNSLQASQTLLWTDLSASGEASRELSALVTPGNRAVSVRANDEDGTSVGLIRPGDYVDVIGVLSSDATSQRASAVLLQRVLVLAVGQETSPGAVSDKSALVDLVEPETFVTLSVALAEAQLLALLAEKGRVVLVLRNPGDHRVAEHVPDLSYRSLLDRQQREDFRNVREREAAPPAPVATTADTEAPAPEPTVAANEEERAPPARGRRRGHGRVGAGSKKHR